MPRIEETLTRLEELAQTEHRLLLQATTALEGCRDAIADVLELTDELAAHRGRWGRR